MQNGIRKAPRRHARWLSTDGECKPPVPLPLEVPDSLLIRSLYRLRSLVLWCLWVFLVVIWFATLLDQWRSGNRAALWLATVAILLLFILYFAEGIELAVTDLLDKEPDQIRDLAVRRTLEAIQSRSAFFYAQRQVFVVVIIAFTSLATVYPWLYVPFAGRVTAHDLPFWFSLVFTTLTILWFSQVTPKRLAVLNSELFLAQSRFVWAMIQGIAILGLPDPSDQLVSVIQRNSGYRHSRHLLPSRAAHYDLTSRLQGLALDRCSMTITLDEHGAARLVKRHLVLFLQGGHGRIDGALDAKSTFAEKPVITLLGLYLLPAAERFESLASRLDELFANTDTGACGEASNIISDWAHSVHSEIGPSELGAGQRVAWHIDGELLPERFWSPIPDETASGAQYAALLYSVEAQLASRAFDCTDRGDSWSETVTLPSRVYEIAVRASPRAEISIVATEVSVTATSSRTVLTGESERLTKMALANRGTVSIPYPLQGATYTVRWRVLPSGTVG